MIIVAVLIAILVAGAVWSAMVRRMKPGEDRPYDPQGARRYPSQDTTSSAQGSVDDKTELWRRLPPRIRLADTVSEHAVAPVPGSILSAPDHNYEFFMRHIGF